MAYEVYRIDLEVNGDKLEIAKLCQPTTPEPGRKGCNFWDFIKKVGGSPGGFDPDLAFPNPNDANGPAVTARQLVADPWAPQPDEVRNWYKFNMVGAESRAPSRLEMGEYFPEFYGKSKDDAANKFPGEDKTKLHKYFEWDNFHGFIGKRIKEYHATNSKVAEPHIQTIRTCLRWSKDARRQDTAGFKMTAFEGVLKSFKVHEKDSDWQKKIVTRQETSKVPGAGDHFGTWTEVDYKASMHASPGDPVQWKPKLTSNMKSLQTAIKNFENEYQKGDMRKYKNKGTQVGGSSSAKTHTEASNAASKLYDALGKLGTNACEMPGIRDMKLKRL